MKKLFLWTLLWSFATLAWSQSTGGFNYKALISENGSVLANHSLSLRFTILQNGNTNVYEETHSATTDANGIVSVVIGEGTVVSGDFNAIDWASGPYSLKVEIDTGSGYQDFGTSELKAVPFAKYAEKAGDAWSLKGNAGTDPSTDFIGTTDATDLAFRVNNVEKIRITQQGQLEFPNNGGSIFIGEGAGEQDAHTLTHNVFIGTYAGYSNTSGSDNIAIGFSAFYENTTGSYNTALGYYALYSNQTGNANTALGVQALTSNTTGIDNTATGFQVLSSNSTGSFNTAYGWLAMAHNTSGSQNVAIGKISLYQNLTGNSNIAIGAGALYRSQNISHLVAIGDSALFHNGENASSSLDAIENIAVGSKALYTNTTGSHNTAMGYRAMYFNQTGNANTAIGEQTLKSNISGTNNTATGFQALFSNRTGSFNTAYGRQAMILTTSGSQNVAIGNASLSHNLTGNSNIAIGAGALYRSQNISHLVAIGDSALFHNGENVSNDWDGTWNTAVGSKALYANTTGLDNTAMGFHAMYSNQTGNSNTAIGNQALISNTTGDSNTAIGAYSLQINQQGNYNTALGEGAGLYNQSGSGNVFIGAYAGANETGSNKLYIANSSTATPLIGGDFDTNEVTINGSLEVTGKLTAAPSGGNSDLKAYVYGFVFSNGNIQTEISSGGFTVTQTGTGQYKINLTGLDNNNYRYMMVATAEIGGSTPVFAAVDYVTTSGHRNEFYVKIFDPGGNFTNSSFHFVVFRK